ncbi:probable leucine-rich repeat receptor-like serine/threonine-protein kinase At3g14840 [Euphorbia lathyris]|uniref:probable leucine-rich repeat receptor-like serine/threonine-protein kinase At3g14840 n=1 Tax=Euphorbia lathyris TaxID=212925 RepID=UPI003313E621
MARFGHCFRISYTLLLLILLLLICWEAAKIEAQSVSLPDDEVQALREIAEQMGKKDWNFSVNPCNDSNWQTPKSSDRPLYNNTIRCNCTTLDGVCHVVSISLKGQDLAGVLPPSIVKLPHLKTLDFYKNYLSGNIPPEWASTKLEFISVAMNHLTGQIPSYLGNITSLVYLSIENNLFNGNVPPQLGKLVNLENLVLNANNFSGELPLALTHITKLTDLRISSNNFSGKLPSFIQNWKQLKTLEIQGSGLEGPIPSSISALNNLTELRISDLRGEGSKFPSLENMENMVYLMLRNCNISGPLPYYVTGNGKLKTLDVSFNRMSGDLATNFDSLTGLEIMYLTGNSFTGPIPNWIKQLNTRTTIDLSYNNFTRSSLPTACRETLNLFKSSSGGPNKTAVECLNNFPCSKVQYAVHINCGGGSTRIGSITYEGDDVAGGGAKYVPTRGQWELSTTGHYWDGATSSDDYIAKNVSVLRMDNSELYTAARLSPLSFTYYVRCLGNGTYDVKLHFVEIIIRDNRSSQSLGRRIFDVYIQGKLVLKDFEIKKEAQGVDKVLIKEFKAVINDGTLEIQFRWAGKGTTHAPIKASYGPIVSLIDVKSEFEPPSESKINISAVLLATILPLFFIFIVVGILWWKGCFRGKPPMDPELVGLDLLTGRFTFRQIKAATNNFDPANKIGEGGFGAVFKGKLSDGTTVAVKQLSSKSKQGNREFVTEIGMISGLEHPNLVKLYGCCVEGKQLLLVYEYMENNSVQHVLFGEKEGQVHLDWPTRQKICIGIAKGLAFLHDESAIKIVHRDIKTSNVLLDKNLNPKISDFGLAKLDEDENTHISTRIAGTIGYMAPEYALYGHLTFKADVYSFGIVLLEIVAGERNMKHRPDQNYVCLLDWAQVLQQKGYLMELVDPRLESKFKKGEVERVIEVGLLCTNPSPALRPTMSTVVKMLQGKADVHELVIDPSYGDESRFKGMRKLFRQLMFDDDSSGTQSLGQPSIAMSNNSSSSAYISHNRISS